MFILPTVIIDINVACHQYQHFQYWNILDHLNDINVYNERRTTKDKNIDWCAITQKSRFVTSYKIVFSFMLKKMTHKSSLINKGKQFWHKIIFSFSTPNVCAHNLCTQLKTVNFFLITFHLRTPINLSRP